MTTPRCSLQLYTSMMASHIYKTIAYKAGQQLEIIVDTESPITLKPIFQLERVGVTRQDLCSTKFKIKGMTGHNLQELGQLQTDIREVNSGIHGQVNLIITKEGPSVLGFDGLRALHIELSFSLSAESPLPDEIRSVIHDCGKCSGGTKIQSLHLETLAEPIFFKACPISYGLRPAVHDCIKDLESQGILSPVETS